MSLAVSLIPVIGSLLDKFLPDPQKKAEMQLELLKMEQSGQLAELQAELQLSVGQLEINKTEAAHPSVFVSGWRPAAGWTAVGGLFYQLLFRPIGGWIMEQTLGWKPPPSLEVETLMTLLFGMLGLGGFRTYEKFKGVAR